MSEMLNVYVVRKRVTVLDIHLDGCVIVKKSHIVLPAMSAGKHFGRKFMFIENHVGTAM